MSVMPLNYFPFGEVMEKKAMDHAMQMYPNESCGFIVEGNKGVYYRKVINNHDDPRNHFKIDTKSVMGIWDKIKAFIHSHPNGPYFPSFDDQEHQLRMAKPWGIVTCTGDFCDEVFFWGKLDKPYPMLNRPFKTGVFDCHSLVSDFYFVNYGIRLPTRPRDENWWREGINLLTDHYEEDGFENLPDIDITGLQVGDVLLGKILGNIPNHCGVYVGNNQMLHHLTDRVSRHDYLTTWWKFKTHVLRHKDVKGTTQKNTIVR